MKTKKVLVILGQPYGEGTAGKLADAYEAGAREAGHEVKRINLGELSFDPVLHHGYRTIQQLEPDLIQAQDDIRWADHIAVFYPNWWSTMPALLKGFFDRVLLPGYAFHFEKNSPYFWKRLFKGKTGRIVISMNVSPLMARVLFGDFSNEIRRGIFWFCGIWPTRVTTFGPAEYTPETVKKRWYRKIKELGEMAR